MNLIILELIINKMIKKKTVLRGKNTEKYFFFSDKYSYQYWLMIDVDHLNKMLNDLHKVIHRSVENTKYKILLVFSVKHLILLKDYSYQSKDFEINNK
jgi:hypothetical protein